MKNKELLNMLVSLTLIAVVAALALAACYNLTKAPIEQSKRSKQQAALQQVLPGFTGETREMKFLPIDGKDSLSVFLAYENERWVGVAVNSYTDKGFSGRFTVMVGFDTTGKITGTEVLEMNETPGLGDNIKKEKSDFSKQFDGKIIEAKTLSVKKDGGDIDAITAATISSRAYCDAVNRAHDMFLLAKKEVNYE
ncbi:MAG: RnfABCDGE type electron transport complex subunit G [Bacteroidales bacterium]|jgi:electron transport complex protein RnfG|nr:RnfABCDGE type electron transport complex subunit G [Bacteroidales bacterium]